MFYQEKSAEYLKEEQQMLYKESVFKVLESKDQPYIKALLCYREFKRFLNIFSYKELWELRFRQYLDIIQGSVKTMVDHKHENCFISYQEAIELDNLITEVKEGCKIRMELGDKLSKFNTPDLESLISELTQIYETRAKFVETLRRLCDKFEASVKQVATQTLRKVVPDDISIKDFEQMVEEIVKEFLQNFERFR